jgi:hypothetical protein
MTGLKSSQYYGGLGKATFWLAFESEEEALPSTTTNVPRLSQIESYSSSIEIEAYWKIRKGILSCKYYVSFQGYSKSVFTPCLGVLHEIWGTWL